MFIVKLPDSISTHSGQEVTYREQLMYNFTRLNLSYLS